MRAGIDEQPLDDENNTVLFSFEDCLKDKVKQAKNFRHVEEESNKYNAKTLWQKTGKEFIKINPPYEPLSEEEVDASFDLPYLRLPHPKYKGMKLPALDRIKFSVNIHRGCF